jgi:histidine triad (HIT) family protein
MDLAENIKNNPTVFGSILRGEIPAKKVYEDDKVFAFHTIEPKAKVHILVIPKKHIISLCATSPEDAELLGYLLVKVREIAEEIGINEGGFRMLVNSGENSSQEVPHLHFHILGGERLTPWNG